MQAVAHGIQKIDFVNDQGERIEGTRLFVGYRDEKVLGQRTVPGAVLELSFDINKRLDKLVVVSTPAAK